MPPGKGPVAIYERWEEIPGLEILWMVHDEVIRSQLEEHADEGRTRLVELFAMDVSANHVVIVGGSEATDGLLSIVLDDGKAIPLFDSLEEAETFLASIGNFGKDWRTREVTAAELIELLEYQGDEVEYVALSPPPENLEGGMEMNVIYREILTDLLRRQVASGSPKESRGFWRGLFER